MNLIGRKSQSNSAIEPPRIGTEKPYRSIGGGGQGAPEVEGQERGEIAKPEQPRKFNVQPDYIKPKTLADIGLTRNESSAFKAIASIPEDTFEAAIAEKKEAVDRALNELTTAGMVALSKGKSNAMVNVWTGNQENYTPENSIIAVRKVLGSIDLDPASCELANRLIRCFFIGAMNVRFSIFRDPGRSHRPESADHGQPGHRGIDEQAPRSRIARY